MVGLLQGFLFSESFVTGSFSRLPAVDFQKPGGFMWPWVNTNGTILGRCTGAPPILEPSGWIGMFTGGTGCWVLTHGPCLSFGKPNRRVLATPQVSSPTRTSGATASRCGGMIRTGAPRCRGSARRSCGLPAAEQPQGLVHVGGSK